MSSSFICPKGHRILATILLSLTLIWLPVAGLVSPAQAQEQRRSELTFALATTKYGGVVLEWGSSELDNLGFNIYRTQDGRRTRINPQLIPGAVFLGPKHIAPVSDRSYSWFDPSGSSGATYQIESVSLSGQTKLQQAIISVTGPKTGGHLVTEATSSASEDIDPRAQTEFPAAQAQPASINSLQDQWAVAGQSALKILIKQDDWYRVTREQMVAAGFNPSVDISNLRLFGDGIEVGLRTNKTSGPLAAGDYIEFYGRALDTPTADTRVYYLIAGNTAGKRLGVFGSKSEPRTTTTEQQRFYVAPPVVSVNRNESASTPSSATEGTAPPNLKSRTPVSLSQPYAFGLPDNSSAVEKRTLVENQKLETSEAVKLDSPSPRVESDTPALAQPLAKAVVKSAAVKSTAAKSARKNKSRNKRRTKRSGRARRHHAAISVAMAADSFQSTVKLKERYRNDATGFAPVYYVSLLNGDAENYFGRVIASSPVTQKLTVSNVEYSAPGPASLEVALQGVLNTIGSSHTVNVELNGTQVGTMDFGPLDHAVQTINVPVGQIVNGLNVVTLRKTSTGEVCIVDYVSLTYPHSYKADNAKFRGPAAEINPLRNSSLRFALGASASITISGFRGPSVLLLNTTDPSDVKLSHPNVFPADGSFNMVVPADPSASGVRTFYALQEGRYATAAGFTLNTPSALNASAGTDMVIIAHKSLMASAAPLVSLRQSQGLTVSVVDIEDVYDEFSYGAHGPQAIRDFLQHAKLHWTTPPRYVILLGDADLDPRNYEGVGDFDLVPTKLVDASFSETASDDWLTDFDNDGIADIPTGRIPVRTASEANLVISKIVNFAPASIPQTAVMVADNNQDPPYYFDFEAASDQVAAFLPQGMTIQKIYRRLQPSNCVARTNILNAMGQGAAVINYSGHGNVNVWAGSCQNSSIFQTQDAQALTNANKLPVVIVSNCLNGYFQDPRLESIAEGFVKALNGGAVAVFASSGETIPDGQQAMSVQLYQLLYGSQPIAIGDAVKTAKSGTLDIDVRRTWILFGDPSMKIR